MVISQIKSLSLWDMVYRYLTVGDPWGFKKILGYLQFRFIFNIFGPSAEMFMAISGLIHFVNTWLVYRLGRRYLGHSAACLFGALVFNRLFLTYFSNVHEYLVTFFILYSIYRSSITGSILAVLTKEVGLLAPITASFLTSGRRRLYLGLIALYCFWQAPSIISRFSQPAGYPYHLDFSLLSRVGNYFNLPAGVTLIMSALLYRRRHILWLLLSAASLVPVLFLTNRTENYYLYLPMAFLGIFFAVALPRFRPSTAVIYLSLIFIFGGRYFFPLIPKQIYPNWQKHSQNQVLAKITSTLTAHPSATSVDLSDVFLERDAKLMLESGTLDVFLPASLSARYKFSFQPEQKTVLVTLKN